MVDMDDQYREPQLSNREIAEQLQTNLATAVEAVTGDAARDPLEVFPNPADQERREDVEFGAELTGDQEDAFRSAMAELGIGRETNRDAAEVGLADGYLAFLEGGQSHKMLAELNVTDAASVRPSVIVISGDSGRAIPEKERALTSKVLGIEEEAVGQTEAEVAEQVFRAHAAFEPQEEQILPYGYTQDGELTSEATGQFRQVGLIGGVPAVVMSIDREYYEDESGERRFKRPDNFTKMQIVAQLEGVEQIGFATSATYQPSIEIDAMRATSATDTVIKVPTYGTAELASVKGEELPQPPALNQLAGEAYKTAQQLSKIDA